MGGARDVVGCGRTISFIVATSMAIGCSSGSSGTSPPAVDDSGAIVDDASAETPSDDAAPFPTADHAPFPVVTAGDGHALYPTTIVSIVASNDTIGIELHDFVDAVVVGKWWSTVVSTYALDTAKTLHVTGPAMTSDVTWLQMHQYVRDLQNAGSVPLPDNHTVYLLWLPDGVNYVTNSGRVNTKCAIVGGAHERFGSLDDNLAFVQRCKGTAADALDDVTVTASHEIVESVTDPTGSGWALAKPAAPPWSGDVWQMLDDGAPVEVGDLCEGTLWPEHAFYLQRTWSPDAAAAGGDPCVPAIKDPWFDVSPAAAWSTVAPGATADLTVTAWSTGPIADWKLSIRERMSSSPGELHPTWTATRSATTFGVVYPIVNNGETATLHVTAPPTAHSGDWVAFEIDSESTGKTVDSYHLHPVGFYVP